MEKEPSSLVMATYGFSAAKAQACMKSWASHSILMALECCVLIGWVMVALVRLADVEHGPTHGADDFVGMDVVEHHVGVAHSEVAILLHDQGIGYEPTALLVQNQPVKIPPPPLPLSILTTWTTAFWGMPLLVAISTTSRAPLPHTAASLVTAIGRGAGGVPLKVTLLLTAPRTLPAS